MNGWPGQRMPTVSPPAVTTSGIFSARGKTSVSGPGQKAFENLPASSGQVFTQHFAIDRANNQPERCHRQLVGVNKKKNHHHCHIALRRRPRQLHRLRRYSYRKRSGQLPKLVEAISLNNGAFTGEVDIPFIHYPSSITPATAFSVSAITPIDFNAHALGYRHTRQQSWVLHQWLQSPGWGLQPR